MSKNATICVDRELRDKLKIASAVERKSLQSIVETILWGYLKKWKGGSEAVNLREAADYLGIHEKTLRRWLKQGKISGKKTIGAHGEEYSFTLGDIQAIRKRGGS